MQSSKAPYSKNKKFNTMQIKKITVDLKDKDEEANGPKEIQKEMFKYQPKK
jgi:hypothetical protein